MEGHEIVLAQKHRDLFATDDSLAALIRDLQHDEEMIIMIFHLRQLQSRQTGVQVQRVKVIVSRKDCRFSLGGIYNVRPGYTGVGNGSDFSIFALGA